MDTLQRVERIFRDIFARPDLTITMESSAATVEGWDSFNQISLIIALEEEFAIKFALAEIDHLRNVGDMVALLDRKVSNA